MTKILVVEDIINKKHVLRLLTIVVSIFLIGYFLEGAVDILATDIKNSLENYLEISAELLSVFVSFSIFAMTWYAYGKSRDNHSLFLGCAFLIIGFLSLFHTFSYPFMPDFVTPNSSNKSAFFFIESRLILTLLFLASAYIYKDTLPNLINKPVLLSFAIFLSVITLSFPLLYNDYLFARHNFSTFSDATVFLFSIITAFSLYASYLYARRIKETRQKDLILLTYGIIIVVFSNLVYFSFELSGHLLIIAGFFFIYHALYKSSVELPYEKLALTEEKLRQAAEGRYKNLFDNANDAIITVDTEGRITSWNKGAERLYGWTEENIIGKNANELLYKDKEESLLLVDSQKSLLEKGQWLGELCHVTKEGKKIIVESRWTLMHDSEGKPKSILVINTDITEKKKLEAQFLRAQRMESIGTLASGIAHDINNVLTPIMLSLQLLKEKFMDDGSQKLINTLERSAQRGASLIKQVQSFARGVECERVTLQVTHLISEIKQIAKQTFPRSIEIRTNTPKDLWTISGDATQLHQVLMNLCVNARDAMPDGGILSISAENLFIDEDFARINIEARIGHHIVISITDTGTGIHPEILDRIFEPFFTTKEPGKGTGLGLSTALAIVKSHGGFINVCSEVEKGTVFKVYLPTTTITEIQKADKQLHELPRGHGESILVVDDESQIREITSSILERSGYRVLTANDAARSANNNLYTFF